MPPEQEDEGVEMINVESVESVQENESVGVERIRKEGLKDCDEVIVTRASCS
jgi:hypothetical protein